MSSQTLIPRCTTSQRHTVLAESLSVAFGVALIALLAQLEISVPRTAVPITGQTFGVCLIGLLWGWKRAALVMSLYLAAGMLGAPVFAGGSGGFELSPTFGYLVGMGLAAPVMGYFADRGLATRFLSALLITLLGTLLIFAAGLAGLAYFLPAHHLLDAGFWPFLPGAVIKCVLAAALGAWLNQRPVFRVGRG